MDDAIVVFLFGAFIGALFIGAILLPTCAYNNYMDGVDDCAEFYKFYNDTDKDVDIDFWVDFADDRFYYRYYDFKEVYIECKK